MTVLPADHRADLQKLEKIAGEPASLETEEEFESCESDRQTATKLGVNRMTLTAWLGGRDRPQRCMLARLAGFLRRVGYL